MENVKNSAYILFIVLGNPFIGFPKPKDCIIEYRACAYIVIRRCKIGTGRYSGKAAKTGAYYIRL
jgi:hypothetical protein